MPPESKLRDVPQQAGGRVIVLLDDSPESMRALEAAAGLARLRHGALLGVFVEEVDLVRSAGFAFAGEIGAVSGRLRPRARDRMAAEIRRRIRQVGRALEETAAASGIEHELIVRRGRVVQETLAFSASGDTLILGRVGWSQRLGCLFGSVPLALAREAPGTVLIWTANPRLRGGRVAVLAENGSTLESSLAVARERTRLHDSDVCVLLPPGLEPAQIETVERQVAAFGSTGPATEMRCLAASNVASLLHALGQVRADELVLSRCGRLLGDPAGARLFERIRMPVCVAP